MSWQYGQFVKALWNKIFMGKILRHAALCLLKCFTKYCGIK